MFTQVSSGLGGDPRQLARGLDGLGASGCRCCADAGRRHRFELPGKGSGGRVQAGGGGAVDSLQVPGVLLA